MENLACLLFYEKKPQSCPVWGHITEAETGTFQKHEDIRRRNCVLSQNETRHENFQKGIFPLAFLTAFEAFNWSASFSYSSYSCTTSTGWCTPIGSLISSFSPWWALTALWWVVWDWSPHWGLACVWSVLCVTCMSPGAVTHNKDLL